MNQAIVMNSGDGVKQIQYIIVLNKITDATNIISALRISNNRFCIFLKNQQITNDIINKHSAIYIDNIEVPCICMEKTSTNNTPLMENK